jgi:hypothetical protein
MNRAEISEAEQLHNFTVKCAADPLFFGKWIAPQYFPSKFASFHYHMIREIEECPKNIDKIVIECPRGVAKTLLVSSLLSIHDCVYNGLKYIVIGSFSDLMAGRIVSDCKNMVKSDRFKAMFPMARIVKDSVYLLEVDNRDEDGGFHFQIMSRGRGSQVTGLRFEEARIQRYIGDDLEDPESVYNQDVVDKNENHIIEVVAPAMAAGGKIILIGTPFAFDCTTERFSRKARGVKTIKYPILVDNTLVPGMSDKLGIVEGHSIWNDDPRFTDEAVWQKRDDMIANGELDVFMRQFMLDPRAPGTIKFDMSKVKYITPDEIGNVKLNIFILSDFAYSTQPWADDSAIVVVGIDDDNNHYVMWAEKGKWGDVVTTDKVIALTEQFKSGLRMVGVETRSFQFVKERILQNRPAGAEWGITDLKPEKNASKPERIKALIPLLDDGKLYIFRGLKALEGEMMRFRGEKMAHGDDLMDSLAYIKQVAYKPQTEKTREEKEKETNHRLWTEQIRIHSEYKNQPDTLRRVHDSNRDMFY